MISSSNAHYRRPLGATLGVLLGLSGGAAFAKPTLKLVAMPPRGDAPLTVHFRGTLEDVDETDETYYCLDADWDMDDSRSLQQPDCPPFEPGKEFPLVYTATHTFSLPGTYRVRLLLRRGDEVLLRDEIWIKAIRLATTDADRLGAPDEVPQRVEVRELAGSGLYDGRRVIVKGKLESRSAGYVLIDRKGLESVELNFARTVMQGAMDPGFYAGGQVAVTGRFRSMTALGRDNSEGLIYVERIVSLEGGASREKPPEPVERDIEPDSYERLDLRELLRSPETYRDTRVAVIGKFRGNNIYDDLPFETKKTPRDFVIKVADAAIWVTGMPPQGKDFALDPKRHRDTGKWLEVIGVPWIENSQVYLMAEKITLTEAPADPDLEPVEPKQEDKEPVVPPEVVFTLPVNGERNMPLDTVFRIQFSKDMAPESFEGKVRLLYTHGAPAPAVTLDYDAVHFTLVVTPQERLEAGREVQLVVFEGIIDEDGASLLPAIASRRASLSPGGGPRKALILTFVTQK